MAHLTARGGKRGQILVVSAFALGVLFVALALILNSAIFTENLASRGETTGGEQVIKYQDTLERGVGKIVTAENENVSEGDSTSHSDLEDRVRTGLNDMSGFLIRQNARAGATSVVTIDSRTDGTLVRQTDSTRNYTNANAIEDWTPVLDVDQTRAFQFNVTRSGLGPCQRFSSCFVANVTDGTDEWKVSINDSSGVRVAVDNGSGTATCDPVSESHVTVDLTAGTVDGDSCSALNFSETPNTGYDIVFRNGDQISGTYSFTTDNSSLATGTLPTDYAVGTNPSATPALYDVTLEYDYQTAQLNYSSAVRVAPGETDE